MSTLKEKIRCSLAALEDTVRLGVCSGKQIENTIRRLAACHSTLYEITELSGTVIYARGRARLNDTHGLNIRRGIRVKAGDEITAGKDGIVGIKIDNRKISTIEPDTQALLMRGEIEKSKPYVIQLLYLSAEAPAEARG